MSMQEAKAAAVVGLQRAVGIGFYAYGALTGSAAARFFGLRAAAERSLERKDLIEAESLARELVALAEAHVDTWNYGNAIHHGHRVLGHVALERGDAAGAGRELVSSANTPGSPQLNSFGPNMSLAKALLERGEREPVLQYFELCSSFWAVEQVPTRDGVMSAAEALAMWAEKAKANEIPDFGPNLVY